MFRDFIKKRWPLFIVLIIFVFFKYPHLYSSFYWDESWPYASGVYKMYQNGPSLLPGAINGELARGHPLLFHFLGAIWLKVFGSSIFSLHCYALSISVFFLISIYEVALRFSNIGTASLAIILVAFQQMYFVQSAFVLLEILLGLLVFLSIYFYASKRYVLTAVSLTLLFYTKESGLVLGFVLGIDAVIRFFNKEESANKKWIPVFSLLFPLVMIILFFLMQKKISGWYVLPLYSNGFEETWAGFYDKFRASVKVVFRDDYRKFYFLLFVTATIWVASVQKRIRLLVPVITGILILLLCSDRFHNIINGKLLLVCFTIGLIWSTIELNKLFLKNQPVAKKTMLIIAVFSIFFFAFTSVNLFFIDRYVLCALIPILFMSAIYFAHLIIVIHKHILIPILILIVIIQYFGFKNTGHLGDNHIGAFDGIHVHEQIVRFLEKNNFKNAKIGVGGYLEVIHLRDPNTKYLSSSDTFKHVTWDINESTEIVIFDNIEPDYRYNEVLKDSSFKLIFKVSKGDAWGEIYRRIQ